LNLLLDTCAILALARGELSPTALAALRAAPEACVSVVSPWEVAIKTAAGKLHLPEPPFAWFLGLVDRYSLRELPLDSRTVCTAAALPPIHRDPFDRVLVALAQEKTLVLLTSDMHIREYPGLKTIW
jgi:PIN domain nuclease of toxin-antitoxin system